MGVMRRLQTEEEAEKRHLVMGTTEGGRTPLAFYTIPMAVGMKPLEEHDDDDGQALSIDEVTFFGNYLGCTTEQLQMLVKTAEQNPLRSLGECMLEVQTAEKAETEAATQAGHELQAVRSAQPFARGSKTFPYVLNDQLAFVGNTKPAPDKQPAPFVNRQGASLEHDDKKEQDLSVNGVDLRNFRRDVLKILGKKKNQHVRQRRSAEYLETLPASMNDYKRELELHVGFTSQHDRRSKRG
jgi:hypothetical protein